MNTQIQTTPDPNIILIDVSWCEKEDVLALAEVLKKQYIAKSVYLASRDMQNTSFDSNLLEINMHIKEEEVKETKRILFHNDYYLDDEENIVLYKNDIIKVTKKEKELLLLLIKNKGELVTFDEIVFDVWKDPLTTKNTVRNLVCRLRKKFASNIIESLPCSGYKMPK